MRTLDETILDTTLEFGVTNSAESKVIDLSNLIGYSIHAKWTKVSGTLAGTIKLQKCNDTGNWRDVPSSQQNITDASGHYEWEVPEALYKHVKVVAALSGGKATVESYAFAKGA